MGRLPVQFQDYSITELRQRLEAAQYLEDETRRAKEAVENSTPSGKGTVLPVSLLPLPSLLIDNDLESTRSPAAAPPSPAVPTTHVVHVWSEGDKAALALGIQTHSKAWAAIARDENLIFSCGLSGLSLRRKANKLKSYANSETFKTYLLENTLQTQ